MFQLDLIHAPLGDQGLLQCSQGRLAVAGFHLGIRELEQDAQLLGVGLGGPERVVPRLPVRRVADLRVGFRDHGQDVPLPVPLRLADGARHPRRLGGISIFTRALAIFPSQA